MRTSFKPMLFAATLGLAFVLSQLFIYQPWVVPQLANWQSVPLHVWAIVFAPELAVCIGAVYSLRTAKSLAAFCVFGGLFISACQFIFGLLDQAGFHKAVEGGLLHFGFQFVVVTLLLFVAVGIGAAMRLGVSYVHVG